MFFKLGRWCAENGKAIKSFAGFLLWVFGLVSILSLPNSDSLLYGEIYFGLSVVMLAAYVGKLRGRDEIRDRLIGTKTKDGQWEVRDGTELMCMKWVGPYWVYNEGNKQRRIIYRGDHWEFEDGSRPDRALPGLREIKGHWENADGKTIYPSNIDALEFADMLRDWANTASKFIPLGIEATKVALNVIEQDAIIQSYGKVLQQPGAIFRQESELPFPKAVIRRRLADALLHHELDEKTRNGLEVGYVELEAFLAREEFDLLKPLFEIFNDKIASDYAERVRLGAVTSAERLKLVGKLAAMPNPTPVVDKVCKRQKERLYQVRVFRSIAEGEMNPDMARLMENTGK